jgi:uncharacterized protein (TIGR00369 family)
MNSDSRNNPSGSGRFDHAPIAQLFGFQIEPGWPGEAKVHLPIDERLFNPMGKVHGGAIAALADAAMGIAFGRTLDDHQDFATIDLHIQFMRPVRGDRLTAKAKMRQRGLRIGYVECELLDDRDRLVATASCSCTVVSLG